MAFHLIADSTSVCLQITTPFLHGQRLLIHVSAS
jgi:hypothetical protein